MQLPPSRLSWSTTLIAGIVLTMHVYFLWAALANHSYLTDDSIQYLTLSENLSSQGTFSQSFSPPFVEDVQRTPGYPVFLMLLGNLPALVLVFQHLLVLAAAWLLHKSAVLLYRHRVAAAGARLYLLQPYPIVMASYFLSETLFIFLLMLAFWTYIRFWKGEGIKWFAIALAVLAVATLVRPVAGPLLVAGGLLGLLKVYRLQKQMIWRGILALVVPLVILGPWYARNHQISGQWSISTMGDMGMLHGRLGGLEAWRGNKPMDELQFYMAGDSIAALEMGLSLVRHYPSNKQTHETEQLASGMGRLTMRFFWDHPWDAFRFELRCFLEMFKGVGFGWANGLTHSKMASWAAAGIQLICNALMFLGAFLAIARWRGWEAEQRFTFWAIVIVVLVSAAAWADGRYRMVIDPLLLIMAMFVLRRYEKAAGDEQALL